MSTDTVSQAPEALRPEDTSVSNSEDSSAEQAAEERIEISIDSLATGGEGVGRYPDGRIAFVPGSAPGDRLEARVVEQRKSFIRAEAVRVLEPSPRRVEPRCELFIQGTCGGCKWQHIDVDEQRRAKAAIVARELRKPVAAGMELLPMVAEVPPYQWRRRARLHYARPRGAPAAVIGFYAPRSHRVTDVAECPQLEPAVAEIVSIIREELGPHLGSRGEIEILAGHAGQVHVSIRGWCSPRYAGRLLGKGGLHGTIVGAVLHEPPVKGRFAPRPVRMRGGRTAGRIQWGKRYIELEPGLRGRADLFAQASRAGNQALLRAVEQACGPLEGKRVIEFHAGVGNFTRVLERKAAQVVSTDSVSLPWRDKRLRVGPAERVARELIAERRRFDIAVLDPPRTGAAELMAPLIELGPERIVYVSCDPATLARDLEELAQGGYRAESAQPLDLMPQTAHIEVVVTLTAAG